MIRLLEKFAPLAFLASFAAFCTCSNLTVAGATSETTNGRVTGTLVHCGGAPAGNTIVRIISYTYNPVTDTSMSQTQTDTTDSDGKYTLIAPDSGMYNIQAVSMTDQTRLLIRNVHVGKDSVFVPADTMHRPGTIKVMIPGGLDANYGYLYIPGTTIYSLLSDNDGYVMLDSVPACVNLAVYYALRGSSAQPQLVRDSVIVAPGGIINIEYIGWKFSKKLHLNTTASGANTAGTVTNFPVLVRLTSSNFDFVQAKSGGADIRFVKSDGSPLSYEIERWDASALAAEIWVKVDTIYGNNGSQFITMLWGAQQGALQSASAVSLSNGPAVFDTSQGFQGVWHLSQSDTLPVPDATANHFFGVQTATTGVPGLIGTAREFDGVSSFVTMPGTASGKLNFPENGTYCISAWVYAKDFFFIDTTKTTKYVIMNKGDFQYALQIFHTYEYEFIEQHAGSGWNSEMAPASLSTWQLVVGIRSGTREYLYINGVLANDSITVNSNSFQRDTTYNLSLGKMAESQDRYFHGILDEVRISNRAYNADWVKLCFMNQRKDDALVQ